MQKKDNGQIRVYANKGRDNYDFDFLFWSGTPADFGRCQYGILRDRKEREIFTNQEEFFISSTIVNMKNDVRPGASNFYLDNFDIRDSENFGVHVDVDTSFFHQVNQAISINKSQRLNMTNSIFFRTSPSTITSRGTTRSRAGPSYAP